MNPFRSLYGALRLVYIRLMESYDAMTQQTVTLHIGDILTPQGELSENQLLIYTRYLDAKAYLEDSSTKFPLQNRISYATYGAAHDEAGSNRRFAALIASYQKSGYQQTPLTCDCRYRILDGTHRMGLNLLFGQQTVTVHILRRKGKGGDRSCQSYLHKGFSQEELEELKHGYYTMLRALPDHAFLCLLSGGSMAQTDAILKDLAEACTVEECEPVIDNGVPSLLIPLLFDDPQYRKAPGGTPYSAAAELLEQRLQRKYGGGISITKSIGESAALRTAVNRETREM